VVLSSVTTQYFIAYNGFTTPIDYWLQRAERVLTPKFDICWQFISPWELFDALDCTALLLCPLWCFANHSTSFWIFNKVCCCRDGPGGFATFSGVVVVGFDLVFRTGGRLTTLLGVAVWAISFTSLAVLPLSLTLLLLCNGDAVGAINSLGSSVNDLTRPRQLGRRDDEDTALELRLQKWIILVIISKYEIRSIFLETTAPNLKQMFISRSDMQTAYDLRNYIINMSLPMPKREFLKKTRSNTAELSYGMYFRLMLDRLRRFMPLKMI
jgi:hypothetical protein